MGSNQIYLIILTLKDDDDEKVFVVLRTIVTGRFHHVLAYLGRLGTYLPDIQHKRICIKTSQPRKLTTSVDFLHSDFPIITSFFNSQSTQIIFVFYLKQALKQAPSLVGKEKTSRILEKNRRKTEH